MFSNRIANSAKFLQMPAESQLLYFHMILRADDDGVVESYPLIKMLGLPTDNFKVLEAKGFIKQLNEDQVVVIMDWLEHNTIRADRKINSLYKPILDKIGIKTIEPKPRSDVEDNTKRLGGQSTVSVSQVKLSQVKLDKENNAPPNGDIVENLIKEEDKGAIKHDFQYVGLDLYERLEVPLKKKSECIRLAKIYPALIMPALSFAMDYPKPELKWKMFLWKLNELRK